MAQPSSKRNPPGPHTEEKKNRSRKRKRRRENIPTAAGGFSDGPRPTKKTKTGPSEALQSPGAVKHALLAQYYPTTLTLRQYVLNNLPASSKTRRRKIAALASEHADGAESAQRVPDVDVRAQLATLLDTTLVGLHVRPPEVAQALSVGRLQQWTEYSQRDDSLVTLSGGDANAIHFQSEVCFTTQGFRGHEVR